MPANALRLALLHGAEVVDRGAGRLSLSPLSRARLVRQAVRVYKAHRTIRFDGRPAYPELVVIEIAPEIVDACPEMFDRGGCRAIAESIADRLEALDRLRPAIAIAFERSPAVPRAQGFRVARERRPAMLDGVRRGPLSGANLAKPPPHPPPSLKQRVQATRQN